MKDEENKMQSAAPEQQAQPEQTQPESEPAADAAQPGTENEPKAETTAPETPDKKKRPLWRKLLAVFAAALAVPVLLLARLIFAYRLYSVDPVLANYYLELLGLMLLILASYRLSGFAVQAGGPRMFGFYADLTAILAVTLLADGHSAALLPLGGAAALDGFQRAMRMSDIAEKKTEE